MIRLATSGLDKYTITPFVHSVNHTEYTITHNLNSLDVLIKLKSSTTFPDGRAYDVHDFYYHDAQGSCGFQHITALQTLNSVRIVIRNIMNTASTVSGFIYKLS